MVHSHQVGISENDMSVENDRVYLEKQLSVSTRPGYQIPLNVLKNHHEKQRIAKARYDAYKKMLESKAKFFAYKIKSKRCREAVRKERPEPIIPAAAPMETEESQISERHTCGKTLDEMMAEVIDLPVPGEAEAPGTPKVEKIDIPDTPMDTKKNSEDIPDTPMDTKKDSEDIPGKNEIPDTPMDTKNEDDGSRKDDEQVGESSGETQDTHVPAAKRKPARKDTNTKKVKKTAAAKKSLAKPKPKPKMSPKKAEVEMDEESVKKKLHCVPWFGICIVLQFGCDPLWFIQFSLQP